MADANNYYLEEEVLLEMPKGKDLIRVEIGIKVLRGETRKYLDIRTWYPDETDTYRPGKGFAKPLSNEEIKAIAKSLTDYLEALEV